ncbi:exopolyphosphatase [Trichlorobacter lovleyi]|uniref:Ppx/GppA phosphatase family protein n=1 Tax=Trichlorobacter lovleyi TaxID=313985 RepID=UPI00223FF248|nr:exopolyphosphatase [Trichlorobacter lovleyi]QOX78912.1 exopolyphosphatase [Trichlorobacter lovleyi]
MSRRIAAIDFGTNTARLLIADLADDGQFEQVALQRTIVRLGGGFSRETGLADDAIQRARLCLHQFADTIHKHAVDSVRAVATSAVRDAVNGPAFVDQMVQETGIRLGVIDGLTEGRVTLAGVLTGLDQQPEQVLMFDVGGGSTEYTIARGASPLFVHSLPLGVVRLTEGKVDPAAMADKIERELDRLQQQMAQAQMALSPDALLVGTAGTATTLAAISLGMAEYDYRKVNNCMLELQEIQRIYELLLPLSPEQRLSVAGLEKGREDLIIAGSLITLLTLQRFGFSSMKVSDYGLLEGLVVSDIV